MGRGSFKTSHRISRVYHALKGPGPETRASTQLGLCEVHCWYPALRTNPRKYWSIYIQLHRQFRNIFGTTFLS